jgi:phosphoserine phosphatase
MKKRVGLIVAIFFLQTVLVAPLWAGKKLSALDIQGDLLSWNEGPAKQRIVAFVESVSDPANKNFVPLARRRAVIDMDGTILCEKPDYIEIVLTKQRLLEKASADPQLKTKPLYRAVAENDSTYLYHNVKSAIAEAFAGETLQFYTDYCRQFMYTRVHPRFHRAYAEMFFAPMIDLIDYLKDHGFTVNIVSTSQQEFIRSISKEILDISPDHVIGTMVAFQLQSDGSGLPPVFVRTPNYFNPYTADENKVVRIRERGLLPVIFAFGNSSGDLAMLEMTAAGTLPHLVSILDHDDANREYEYHKSKLLKKARSAGWNIVSMQRDFRVVFRPNQ